MMMLAVMVIVTMMMVLTQYAMCDDGGKLLRLVPFFSWFS